MSNKKTLKSLFSSSYDKVFASALGEEVEIISASSEGALAIYKDKLYHCNSGSKDVNRVLVEDFNPEKEVASTAEKLVKYLRDGKPEFADVVIKDFLGTAANIGMVQALQEAGVNVIAEADYKSVIQHLEMTPGGTYKHPALETHSTILADIRDASSDLDYRKDRIGEEKAEEEKKVRDVKESKKRLREASGMTDLPIKSQKVTEGQLVTDRPIGFYSGSPARSIEDTSQEMQEAGYYYILLIPGDNPYYTKSFEVAEDLAVKRSGTGNRAFLETDPPNIQRISDYLNLNVPADSKDAGVVALGYDKTRHDHKESVVKEKKEKPDPFVSLSKNKKLEVHWADGSLSRYSFEDSDAKKLKKDWNKKADYHKYSASSDLDHYKEYDLDINPKVFIDMALKEAVASIGDSILIEENEWKIVGTEPDGEKTKIHLEFDDKMLELFMDDLEEMDEDCSCSDPEMEGCDQGMVEAVEDDEEELDSVSDEEIDKDIEALLSMSAEELEALDSPSEEKFQDLAIEEVVAEADGDDSPDWELSDEELDAIDMVDPEKFGMVENTLHEAYSEASAAKVATEVVRLWSNGHKQWAVDILMLDPHGSEIVYGGPLSAAFDKITDDRTARQEAGKFRAEYTGMRIWNKKNKKTNEGKRITEDTEGFEEWMQLVDHEVQKIVGMQAQIEDVDFHDLYEQGYTSRGAAVFALDFDPRYSGSRLADEDKLEEDTEGFEKWMELVDRKVQKMVGVHAQDLRNADFHDMHEEGMTPSDAALFALDFDPRYNGGRVADEDKLEEDTEKLDEALSLKVAPDGSIDISGGKVELEAGDTKIAIVDNEKDSSEVEVEDEDEEDEENNDEEMEDSESLSPEAYDPEDKDLEAEFEKAIEDEEEDEDKDEEDDEEEEEDKEVLEEEDTPPHVINTQATLAKLAEAKDDISKQIELNEDDKLIVEELEKYLAQIHNYSLILTDEKTPAEIERSVVIESFNLLSLIYGETQEL